LFVSFNIEPDEATSQEVISMEGSLLERGISFYLQEGSRPREGYDTSKIIPHVAGLTTLGLSYAAVGALVLGDGPLPFGDAIALGIIAVPDIVWYGIGYSLVA
jgi:hypothetical protein